jgi:agmatinase
MATREDIIQQFDPNGPGIQGNLFGLPFSPDSAALVLVPVPWEVTVSYHTGTARGPEAILQASSQIDTFIREIPDAWKMGVAMLPVSKEIQEESHRQRGLAAEHISKLEGGQKISPQDPLVVKINEACENLNIFVKSTTQKLLREGKMVGLVGGDHSTPLGFLRALAEQHNRFGVLHIDAHADLRKAYEGFTYSHASIMYNALKLPAVNRLVQVGIRDFCDEEVTVVNRSMGRVVTFFDEYLKDQLYKGKSWDALCDQIIQELPQLVYLSFDIDGLDPKLCPNTGTPVAGGFEFHEAIYLIKKLVRSGKTIIGFDLCEVAAGSSDWDANVGARVLFQLSHWMGVSQRKLIASGNV